jgi:hypothetical protein
MVVREPAAAGVDRKRSTRRNASPETKAPPSPFAQNLRSSRNSTVFIVKAS